MTCRARRESFFWLPVRQIFLFSLFSFSLFSFLFFFFFFQPSRRPCLGSSRLSRAVSACVSRQSSISPIDNPGYPVFLSSSNLFAKQQDKKRPLLPSSSARLTSHPTDKANSPLRHNGRHRQATHCRPGCCLPAHEAKELRCQRAWCHCRLLHRLHRRCWSVWSPHPQVDPEEKSCHQVSDLDDSLRLGGRGGWTQRCRRRGDAVMDRDC